ncbi:hypothetical protein E2C01_046001 [Portunus trituberculatus]|uniref:Uncharacterized protein n=1 Tax=Portunus trituberculatus TaxID=210409 RepID=A0A5B7FWM2_PORTR|nr:hypothetical protein [Portunus trituberculatus]
MQQVDVKGSVVTAKGRGAVLLTATLPRSRHAPPKLLIKGNWQSWPTFQSKSSWRGAIKACRAAPHQPDPPHPPQPPRRPASW